MRRLRKGGLVPLGSAKQWFEIFLLRRALLPLLIERLLTLLGSGIKEAIVE